MKSTLKQIIIDFHQTPLPKLSNRQVELPQLPATLRKALVFTGMRRSGKTWFLYQIMNALEKKGVKREKLLYLNFEDDRLLGCKDNLQWVLDAYFELYPQYTKDREVHFFLDEIHEANHWEKFIRRLLDTEEIQIYLTGSSAKLLSKEIATSLRGRTLVREIFPFSFEEFLDHKKIAHVEPLSTKQKAFISHELLNFLHFGGFPESVGTEPSLHRELLQGYLDTVIYRDIIERYQIVNIPALKSLFHHCLKNAGAHLSVHKMYATLKSQGIAVSKNSLYEYMHYFEDAYCLFSVPLYHFSYAKQNQNPKKIYPVDQGFILACTIKPEFEEGALLECTVFSKLRRTIQEIYYFQTSKGKEVDFLILRQGKIELYQVTISLKDERTRDREISALRQAMLETETKEGTIVTLDESDILYFPEGCISVVPLWKFLLN